MFFFFFFLKAGVKDVFDEAILAVLNKPKAKPSRCYIL
jgi:hypothetical protein